MDSFLDSFLDSILANMELDMVMDTDTDMVTATAAMGLMELTEAEVMLTEKRNNQ